MSDGSVIRHQFKIPHKLASVFAPAYKRYRGAYGGRGSGKTRTFALMTAIKAHEMASKGRRGTIVCAREFQVSIEKSSYVEVVAAIKDSPFLSEQFEIGRNYIRHKSGLVDYTFLGLRHNTESIKGIAHILIVWVDEAEPVTDEAWKKLIPTVREAGSEIWVTWNPSSKRSATHERFREHATEDMAIAEINYSDNPWFPDVLEMERQADLKHRPHDYGHIWMGEFVTVTEGAYIASNMALAKAEGRITRVSADPNLIYRAFVDIGGTGAKADNFVIWVMQYVGREIRVLDHYEVQGQPLSAHLSWMRGKKYLPDNTKIWLPHDGDTQEKTSDASYASSLRDAGYEVEVVPNQGKGAAMFRVEAARRLLHICWFNEETTEGGREALAHYHAKIDKDRGIDLGPNHDWASHSFDAFGMGMIVYEEPQIARKKRASARPVSWMA